MIVTINIDDNTGSKDINLGFKLVNDESKFFDVENIKKLYFRDEKSKRTFWVDVQNPANKKDIGSFEIKEKTAQLIYAQLNKFLIKNVFDETVTASFSSYYIDALAKKRVVQSACNTREG